MLALALFLAVVSSGWALEIGETLPEFTIETLDGGNLSRAALAGKPALLVFWNTWCPDCMRELPVIDRLARQFVPRGLAVLAINTAINDSERRARAYWDKSAYIFPSGFDDGFDVGQAFAVRGVPTIFLVDPGGVVTYKQAKIPADIEERLSKLVSKGQP